MKNTVSILLMLIMLISLVGCNKTIDEPALTNNAEITSVPTEESTAPTIPDNYVIPQIPMISVSMPIVRESELSKNDGEIFNYIYQNMSLILPEPEIADKIIVDFLNRTDKISSNARSIRDAAVEAYTGENWTPYLCQIIYDPMRIDNGVLSLFGCYTEYSGTAHPESTDISVNYDLTNGEVIKLEDIFVSESTNQLIDEINQALLAQKEEAFLFDGFEDTVEDRFKNGFSHEHSWYFSDTGLCFYFSAYEIAPYSSGVIIAEIPYTKLAGIMDDAYFPAEPETVTGALFAEHFTEEHLSKYDSFSEVIVDEGRVKALLYTDSSVYDVRIEVGYWSTDGDIFIPEYTVYAAHALTTNSAIIVESEIADTLPRLRIVYQSNGKTQIRYLTDSGLDGSIILADG